MFKFKSYLFLNLLKLYSFYFLFQKFQHSKFTQTNLCFKIFVLCIFSIINEKPTNVSVSNFIHILIYLYIFRAHWPILRRYHVAVHTTFASFFVPRPRRHRNCTNGCVNSYVISSEDGPVGPKYVEVRQFIIHLAVCLTTGPKPLPKPALHIARSRASSFK
jgi:hypothetical protein